MRRRVPGETVQDFVICLKEAIPVCEYICSKPDCRYDLSDEHLKHQFYIKGKANQQLQADMLAKAKNLDTFSKVVEHAEAFAAAEETGQLLMIICNLCYR